MRSFSHNIRGISIRQYLPPPGRGNHFPLKLFSSSLLLFLFYTFLSGQQYTFRQDIVLENEDLNYLQTTDIFQDSEGYLWFGTRNGLMRYDGYDLEPFSLVSGEDSIVSSQFIRQINKDPEGWLWVTTLPGLIRLDTQSGKIRRYPYPEQELGDALFMPNKIFIEEDGTLWYSLDGEGVVRLNKDSEEQEIFRVMGDGPSEIPILYVYNFHEDRRGNIYIVSFPGGIGKYDREEKHFTRLPLKRTGTNADIKVLSMYEQQDQSLLIGSDSGLYVLPPGSDSLKKVVFQNRYGSLNTNPVHDIRKGPGDITWFRNLSGIYAIDPDYSVVYHHLLFEKVIYTHIDSLVNAFSYLTLLDMSLLVDRDSSIWYASVDGISKISVRTNPGLSNYEIHSSQDNLFYFMVQAIEPDPLGRTWLGTREGLKRMEPGNRRGDYFADPDDPASLPGNSVLSLLWDSMDRFWIGTEKGLARMVETEDTIRFERCTLSKAFPGPEIGHLYEDKKGNIWIGTDTHPWFYDSDREAFVAVHADSGTADTNGLYIAEQLSENAYFGYNQKGGYILRFEKDPGPDRKMIPELIHTIGPRKAGTPGFSNTQVKQIAVDENGTIWLATLGGGLNKLVIDRRSLDIVEIDSYMLEGDLESNLIYGLIFDDAGGLWAGSANGLRIFNRESGSFESYKLFSDLLEKEKYFRIAEKDDRGNLYFGTYYGWVTFNPGLLTVPQNNYPMQITDFRIFDEPVLHEEGAPDYVRKGVAGSLILPYNKNFLSFEYALLNYNQQEGNRYRYKMEGIDRDWIDAGQRRYVSYSDLKPGEYTFRVSGSDYPGIWNQQEASLSVWIRPPLWARWWAYLLYAGLIFLLIRYYVGFVRSRERIRSALELKQVEADKMKEIDRIKSTFFTNISHEFRTPLTLMIGPARDLMQQSASLNPGERAKLGILHRNALRLQELISQLLDFAKMEAGAYRLQVAENDLEAHLTIILSSFLSLAESRNISYETTFQPAPVATFFDPDKVEKIISNLVSNALKFTPEGGKVKVSLTYSESTDDPGITCAELDVADTGPGIPQQDRERIFERFFQVESHEERPFDSSGLGLALTKEMVELHRGMIRVDHNEESSGTRFIVSLPVSETAYARTEITEIAITSRAEEKDPSMVHREASESPAQGQELEKGDPQNPLVLIVEDNEDLRGYISEIVGGMYRIETSSNGKDGLEKARTILPDLVITDIMMPEMDGYELCRHLKKEDPTSHIPVIMLTARADLGSKVSGLDTGADDYISKPFENRELLARIRNLIEQRKILRQKYFDKFLSGEKDPVLEKQIDINLPRILKVLHDQFPNADFGVEQWGDAVALSRSQLYRKIISSTGKKPVELLRLTRLKHAEKLFRSGVDNVTEVLMESGFNSNARFSAYFKDVYGMTPSGFISQIQARHK